MISRAIEKGENLDLIPICNKCLYHIIGDKCRAFEVIPDLIILGDNDHSTPLDGQENNLTYTPKEE